MVGDAAGELGRKKRYAPPAMTASTAITNSRLLPPDGFCSFVGDLDDDFELVMAHANAVWNQLSCQ
jgi:hypothetical protein